MIDCFLKELMLCYYSIADFDNETWDGVHHFDKSLVNKWLYSYSFIILTMSHGLVTKTLNENFLAVKFKERIIPFSSIWIP